MSQALYRRYRPQDFEAVVGQNHVADTLRNALRQGRLGHAYLFTGPRGTGKTSTARILAKAVNCLAADIDDRPDNTCAVCTAINESRLLDLIEIDAASNTSVDDVRELRDRVAFAPTEARYKVYVIDEVHMLSTSAFNALLKTLEEPPAHVIFILATTEPHKIPATVISRCQRFDFHRISTREIAGHLAELARREGVSVTAEGLSIIARSATGSMRDAISLLDQITAFGHAEVSAELVRDVLGMVSGAAVSALAGAIASADPAAVLAQLHHLIAQGVDLGQLVNQLIEHLRVLLLLNVGRDPNLVDLPDAVIESMQAQARQFKPTQLLHAIRLLNEAGLALKTPFAGYLPVEMALLDAVGLGEIPSSAPALRSEAALAPSHSHSHAPASPPAPPPVSGQPAASIPQATPPRSRPAAEPEPLPPPTVGDAGGDLVRQWTQVIAIMRKHSPRIQAMLRSGSPTRLVGGELTVSFRHSFHREEVQGAIDQVSEAVAEVFGRPLTLRLVDEGSAPPSTVATSPDSRSSRPAAGDVEDDPLVRAAVEDLGAMVTRIAPANRS